jgi:15-cis-phytoene synthase
MREGEPPSAADAGGPRGIGTPTRNAAGAAAGAPGPGEAPNTLSASRYLAWLYSPAPRQHVFALLCEIENEIAGSLRPEIDHQVAHARIQWWREECERCAEGRPVHPLTRELVKANGAMGATRLAGVTGFADIAVWDLASATFETRKELTAYCERWSAAMFETAAGPPAETGAQAPRVLGLGAAVRELELLESLAREAYAGRLRVPLDELERAGVDAHAVAKPEWPAALGELLSQRHQALRSAIRDSISALGRDEQSRLRGLLVWTTLAWRQSLRAQRALPNTVQPRRYHALADGWQAWRAARRAAAGKLRFGGSPSG